MKAFLSSTIIDLVPERQALLKVLGKLTHGTTAQENFGALPHQPIDKIYKEISSDSCSYYVLIVGYRYGSLISKTDIPGELSYPANRRFSFCEVEFDLAGHFKRPRFVYLKRGAPESAYDPDIAQRKRREKFLSKIKDSGCTYYSFSDPFDLAVQAAIDIPKWIHDKEYMARVMGPVFDL